VSARQRIDQQPGFVLHSYPYRETSLIVEVFSRDHGRIGLVAKGARRPMSQLRGVLMAFQPLLIDWSGGGEMKTLVRAEWQAAASAGRAGAAVRLLPQRASDAPPAAGRSHPVLYRAYGDALRALAAGEGQEVILRRFELACCRSSATASSWTLMPTARRSGPSRYAYIIERGAVPSTNTASTTHRSWPAGCCSTWPAAISASPKPWPAPRR
jgi:DNA repair protein RecO (recombination protein O)